MVRSVFVGALLVAIGAAGAAFVISRFSPTGPREGGRPPSVHVPAGAAGKSGERTASEYTAALERRLRRLETELAQEVAARHRLEERLDAVAMEGAVRRDSPDETMRASAPPNAAATTEVHVHAVASATGVDGGTSAMERALASAGLDAATAADIKRRHDGLAMAEIYLRDQATREQWLDSPRFADEMAAIKAQETPIRDEIGDDAYDRYLFALGQANRVRVEDVMLESPAAQAGLQPGDLIVRYGESRLFDPGELVAETRTGTAGEAVQLEIIRNGERFEVEVPRGPLGLRVAATQVAPGVS